MTAGPQRHLAVGDRGIVLRRGDESEIDRKRHDGDADPQDRVRNVTLEALVLDHQYVTLRSTKRNWIAVSAMTMPIRITDCAADEPRLPPSRPSE